MEFKTEFGQVTLAFKAPFIEIAVRSADEVFRGQVMMDLYADEAQTYLLAIGSKLTCDYQPGEEKTVSCPKFLSIPAWECELAVSYPRTDKEEIDRLQEENSKLKEENDEFKKLIEEDNKLIEDHNKLIEEDNKLQDKLVEEHNELVEDYNKLAKDHKELREKNRQSEEGIEDLLREVEKLKRAGGKCRNGCYYD